MHKSEVILVPNDILRSLRYLMRINNEKVRAIFELGGLPCSEADCNDLLLSEEDPQFLPLASAGLDAFLNGLVLYKRGPRPEGSGKGPNQEERFSNNIVLKKLKVAFSLQANDMEEIFRLGDFPLTRSEISALTQARTHKNFKLCRDQILRYFLRGLARRENPKALAQSLEAKALAEAELDAAIPAMESLPTPE